MSHLNDLSSITLFTSLSFDKALKFNSTAVESIIVNKNYLNNIFFVRGKQNAYTQ